MIDLSTNNLMEFLQELTKTSNFYYIEQKSIASKEEVDGHTVYSHFKRVDKKITESLLQQHINKEINLAISIKNSSDFVFEYSGKYAYAFGALLFKLASYEDIEKIAILEYSLNKLVIYIAPNSKNITTNRDLAKKISKKLEEKLPLSWRVLPNDLRPNNGNLVILPREIIEPTW